MTLITKALQLKKYPDYARVAASIARNFWVLRAPLVPLKLHLGCGRKRLEGFINIDMNISMATDYVCHCGRLPCPDNSVERIETYHVFEHIPLDQREATLREWLRVLLPGGTLVIECPNLDEAMRQYLAGNTERLFSVFGRQRFPGDGHFWGYTEESLRKILLDHGFAEAVAMPPQDYHRLTEPCIRVEAQKA